jgi:hypothetical protein
MANAARNPWKLATIGLLLVAATAAGLEIATRNGNEEVKAINPALPSSAPRPAPVPSAAVVEACNRHASGTVGDPTSHVVKDALVGGAVGAGVGAAGGAIAGGGKGAGKGAAIGGIVGATAGTLYGLNEAKKDDVRYVEAYRACMQQRGYPG